MSGLRLAEAMRGSGDRRVMPCEEPMLRYRVGRQFDPQTVGDTLESGL